MSALLSGVRFCSVVCARASLLESLALFESSTAAAVVKDVGAVLSAFRQLYLGLSASAS